MRSRWLPHVLVTWAIASATAADAGPGDVPEWSPGPATFAVTPFENHVPNGKSLEWIVAELPFEIAEKTEDVVGLDAIGAPLYVPAERVPAEADTVLAFGARVHATYVVTGWYDKVGDDLRIDAIVWKTEGGRAVVAAESQKSGAITAYHGVVGDVVAEVWAKAGVAPRASGLGPDVVHDRLTRVLSKDIYPVFMMGRGLGYLTGAIGGTPDLKTAEHDLERAVFLDPKLFEAQRLLGELYLAQAPGDPKAAAKATAKFNYATDLAPDDLASLRAAAFATAASTKWELALEMFGKLVTRRPWDLDARFELGHALWQLGDVRGAEKQLEQVTAHQPDHLAARRVLVLVHAARGDTKRLVTELEAIAARAPNDLEVTSDLAVAYGALGQWPKSVAALERVAQARPNELALAVRVGDGHRKSGDLDGALAWYQRASRLAPESSLPGFAAAQALFDAGKLADANRAYTNLQKFAADLYASEAALGTIALAQNRADDAAWYFRRAVREAPRNAAIRRAAVAAELARKDPAAAFAQLEPALAAWPDDPVLHYLAGLAHALSSDLVAARTELVAAGTFAPARAALDVLDGHAVPGLDWKPELLRPWGDGAALGAELGRYQALAAQMATVRAAYQSAFVTLLGAVGQGPAASVKPGSVKTCPVGRLAPAWAAAQAALERYERLGVDLEASYRFVARHDEVGLVAGLLPNARIAVAAAKQGFRIALADVGELRAEWSRGLGPELRAAGCTDALLAAAVANPSLYHVIEEDRPDTIPAQAPPHATPRSTFFVDNTRCPDPVDVWIDGLQIGQVAPGRRGALVADGGKRTLCLLGPGAAQCGDRGTVRRVYLHDGWSVTMHCPK